VASVLLVEKTEVSGENNRPLAIHWQTLLRNVISGTPRLSGFQAYNFKHRDCFWTIPIIIFYKIVENTLLLIVEPIVFIIFHCIMLYVSYFIVSCCTYHISLYHVVRIIFHCIMLYVSYFIVHVVRIIFHCIMLYVSYFIVSCCTYHISLYHVGCCLLITWLSK
jgi:hypothetical protein